MPSVEDDTCVVVAAVVATNILLAYTGPLHEFTPGIVLKVQVIPSVEDAAAELMADIVTFIPLPETTPLVQVVLIGSVLKFQVIPSVEDAAVVDALTRDVKKL